MMRRYYGRREVHTVVLMKMQVYWDVTRCRWVVCTEVSDKYNAFLFRVKHSYFLLLRSEDEGIFLRGEVMNQLTTCNITDQFNHLKLFFFSV